MAYRGPSNSQKVANKLQEESVMGQHVYTHLLELIRVNKGCIAGSIVLQAIRNNPTLGWEQSDIDVWIPSRGKIGHFIDMLTQIGYQYNKTEPKHRPEYARLSAYVGMIHSFRKNGRKMIQIIQCKIAHISQVIKSFDIVAAQIVYTERYNPVTHRAHEQRIGLIKASNSDALEQCIDGILEISETAAYQQTLVEWIRTSVRLVKYKARGFVLAREELDNIVEYVNDQCLKQSLGEGMRYNNVTKPLLQKIAYNLTHFVTNRNEQFDIINAPLETPTRVRATVPALEIQPKVIVSS